MLSAVRYDVSSFYSRARATTLQHRFTTITRGRWNGFQIKGCDAVQRGTTQETDTINRTRDKLYTGPRTIVLFLFFQLIVYRHNTYKIVQYNNGNRFQYVIVYEFTTTYV